MINTSKHVRGWLLACVIIAAVLRLPGLDRVPPLLNQDEASRGYDAWCLLETGADRHGQPHPFFLESFGPGDYTAALTTYLTVPFIAWLGPCAAAMRLPDALLGVATVALMFFWLRRQIHPLTALIAAGILALDPWHIALTRTAHESGFTPFFLVFALMAMHHAGLLAPDDPSQGGAPDDNSQLFNRGGSVRPIGSRPIWGFVAGLLWTMHTWAYPATRLFTPLFFLWLMIIHARFWIDRIKSRQMRLTLLALAAGLLIGGVPLWYTALTTPSELASRAGATLLVHQSLSATQTVGHFLCNYVSHFNPSYWFVQADEMSGASIPHVGLHLAVLAPLWLIGVGRILAGWRRSKWSRLLIGWLVLYPIPAAICGDWNPHPMRSVAGMALFPIIAGMGGQWLLERVMGLTSSTQKIITLAAGTALLGNVAFLVNEYYREFPRSAAAQEAYQAGLYRAIEYVAAHRDEADVVLVTNWSNQPYIYALLLEPIPPKTLSQTGLSPCDGPKGFHQVVGIGRYLFVPQDPQRFPESNYRFQALLSKLPAKTKGFVIERVRADRAKKEDLSIVYRSDQAAMKTTQCPPGSIYVVKRWRPRQPF